MIKKLFRFLIKTTLWFVVLSIVWVLLYRFLPVPATPLMAIRSFQSETTVYIKHDWVPLEDISKVMQLAVISAEDQNFTTHNGFDYEAIKKAYKDNKVGKSLKGGSTISQQTAKNVFLWPGRSWFRKGLETYFTFLIENLWGKERILEVYLNSIEMGEGVYGIQAASKYWFNKDAKNLTKHESAAIAVILPNPRNYKASPRTAYLEKRKQWVLRQMNNLGELNINKNDQPGD
ncbi:MAG: monofunctional biosynthetic peptidoglycan transglycosylase [Bacteroidia bacterium]|nr:monofunctional biosynthetic peptidoglycan transglycosylase [Bacteroidia bacterium]NNF31452.1 monofunctional biosynthetic peptidoglycan transglycosylase [Flavobacteriaceae bacterium]MBT8275527.1 monofunctional biosynthetic peptidoglycan transglycosylase [Bacteroidia bacterium]NNJ82073.1 monofunctional biosynthetic peptidoglycan transglycosylase [Flavobacteriaceae bacterium]NNK54031.1 monofunctional biosynthetic peptidoglycan transglycosylase [Flavobacteriaceae bacterium]